MHDFVWEYFYQEKHIKSEILSKEKGALEEKVSSTEKQLLVDFSMLFTFSQAYFSSILFG